MISYFNPGTDGGLDQLRTDGGRGVSCLFVSDLNIFFNLRD